MFNGDLLKKIDLMFASAILCKGSNVCEIIILPSNEAIFERTMWFRIQLTFKMTDTTPGGYLLCDLNTASALALALATPHHHFSSRIQLFYKRSSVGEATNEFSKQMRIHKTSGNPSPPSIRFIFLSFFSPSEYFIFSFIITFIPSKNI